MRHGFHFAVVEQESGFHQRFAVAGRAGTYNVGVCRQFPVDILQCGDRSFEGAAVVVAVERIEEGTVLTNQSDLGCCASGIDAEITVAAVCSEISSPHSVRGVPFFKLFVFRLGGKERFHSLYFKFHLDIGGKLCEHFFHGVEYVILCVQCGADGSKEMRIVRVNDMFIVQFEGADEGCLELGKEMERAA